MDRRRALKLDPRNAVAWAVIASIAVHAAVLMVGRVTRPRCPLRPAEPEWVLAEIMADGFATTTPVEQHPSAADAPSTTRTRPARGRAKAAREPSLERTSTPNDPTDDPVTGSPEAPLPSTDLAPSGSPGEPAHAGGALVTSAAGASAQASAGGSPSLADTMQRTIDAARRAYVLALHRLLPRPEPPAWAFGLRVRGPTVLALRIEPSGEVSAIRVVTSSGERDLDELARALFARRVTRLPAPPPEAHWARNDVLVPITWRLETR